MNYDVIMLCCIGVFGLIGFIVGLVKGFTRVKSWANEFVLAAIFTILLGNVIEKGLGGKSDGFEAILPAVLVFALALGFLIVLALLSAAVRNGLNKGIEKHKLLIHYKQYDAVQANTDDILDALDAKNKRAYKRYSRRKFKQGGGFWGFTNRLFGGITLAVKAMLIVGLLVAAFLVGYDLFGLNVLTLLDDIYTGWLWSFCKPYLFDFFVVGVLLVCLRSGFKSGLCSALWTLVVIGMVAGAGFIAYNAVFVNTTFDGAAAAFNENCVSQWFSSFGETELTLTVSKGIITAGIFLVLLIIVILVGVLVPKFIDAAREGTAFRVIDGVFGAVAALAIVMGILLFLFGILQTASGLEFMQNFDTYFEKSGIARYVYSDNVLINLNFMPIDLSKWLS